MFYYAHARACVCALSVLFPPSPQTLAAVGIESKLTPPHTIDIINYSYQILGCVQNILLQQLNQNYLRRTPSTLTIHVHTTWLAPYWALPTLLLLLLLLLYSSIYPTNKGTRYKAHTRPHVRIKNKHWGQGLLSSTRYNIMQYFHAVRGDDMMFVYSTSNQSIRNNQPRPPPPPQYKNGPQAVSGKLFYCRQQQAGPLHILSYQYHTR